VGRRGVEGVGCGVGWVGVDGRGRFEGRVGFDEGGDDKVDRCGAIVRVVAFDSSVCGSGVEGVCGWRGVEGVGCGIVWVGVVDGRRLDGRGGLDEGGGDEGEVGVGVL